MKTTAIMAAAVLTATTLGSTVTQAVEETKHEFTANIGLASNYLWRGVTQTDDQAAIQGGVDYGHKSGVYAGTWLSNVKFGGTSGYEQDWYVGYRFKTDPVLWDVGYKLYTYPSLTDLNFGEIYGNVNWKFLTGGVALTTNADDSLANPADSGDVYLYVTGDWTLKGIGLGGTLGHYSHTRTGIDDYSHLQLYLEKSGFKLAFDKNNLDVGNLDDYRFWLSYTMDFDLLKN